MGTDVYSKNKLKIGKGTLLARDINAVIDSIVSFGDCNPINFGVEITKEEAFSNEAGPQILIDEAVTAIKNAVTFTTRNFVPANVAKFFMASEVTDNTQTGATWTSTDYVVNQGEFIDLGYLGMSALTITVGSTPCVKDVDYFLVHGGKHGVIQIIEGSLVIANGATITVSAATIDTTTAFKLIKAATSTTIFCDFLFLGNPVKGWREKRKFYGSISPSGEQPAISDSYSEMSFDITLIDVHTTNAKYESIMDIEIIDLIT